MPSYCTVKPSPQTQVGLVGAGAVPAVQVASLVQTSGPVGKQKPSFLATVENEQRILFFKEHESQTYFEQIYQRVS